MVDQVANSSIADTMFNIWERNVYPHPPGIEPTNAEEVTALRMMLMGAPDVRFHAFGIKAAGQRPEAVEYVLTAIRAGFYERIERLLEESNLTPPPASKDNVVAFPAAVDRAGRKR